MLTFLISYGILLSAYFMEPQASAVIEDQCNHMDGFAINKCHSWSSDVEQTSHKSLCVDENTIEDRYYSNGNCDESQLQDTFQYECLEENNCYCGAPVDAVCDTAEVKVELCDSNQEEVWHFANDKCLSSGDGSSYSYHCKDNGEFVWQAYSNINCQADGLDSEEIFPTSCDGNAEGIAVTCSLTTPQLCPAGSTQYDTHNNDINGGIIYFDKNTITECFKECQGPCMMFSWAEVGVDPRNIDQKVCTIYPTISAVSSLPWTERRVFCTPNAQESITVAFQVEGCTSNCLPITKPEGVITLWGRDSSIADQAANKISEQTFNTNQVPFTLTINYPTDPLNLINPLNSPDSVRYYLSMEWDADGDEQSTSDCDISFDWDIKFPTVDLDEKNPQILYLRSIRPSQCPAQSIETPQPTTLPTTPAPTIPKKCEQTQGCANEDIESEAVYCTGYRACANAKIKTDRLHVEGHRSVEGAQITAERMFCYGSAGAPGSQILADGNDYEQMYAYFFGFGCGSNADLFCTSGATCNIFCDGKQGCNGLRINVDDDSFININPTGCEENPNTIIDGVRCPSEINRI